MKTPDITPAALISGAEPTDNNVGAILIRDMLAVSGMQKYVPVRLVRGLPAESETELDLAAPIETEPVSSGFLASGAKLLKRLTRYESATRRLAGRIELILRDRHVQTVWAILNSTTTIDTVWHLCRRFRTRLTLQVWDAPEHLLQQRRVDRISRIRTLRRFRTLLSNADKVAVIGESMQSAYGRLTRHTPIILRHGLVAGSRYNEFSANADCFRIGFCGGMYALSAWKCLEKALDLNNWTLNNRPVRLEVVGSHIQFDSRRAADARFHGWRSVEETQQLMAGCDLLYLPQAFDGLSRPLTELSFPTKLSTYVSTGCPVLIHSPVYGSLNRFCRDHDFGIVHNTLNAEDLAECLRRTFEGSAESERQAAASARIAREVLSRDRFVAAVRQFVDTAQNAPISTVSAS